MTDKKVNKLKSAYYAGDDALGADPAGDDALGADPDDANYYPYYDSIAALHTIIDDAAIDSSLTSTLNADITRNADFRIADKI